MIKVLRVEIDHIRNETCSKTADYPKGRFPKIYVTITTNILGVTKTLEGITCACGEGHPTYGTWRVPPVGMLFQDEKALLEYMNKNDAYASGHGVTDRIMPTAPSVPYWEGIYEVEHMNL